jgi:hypothetical protein
VFFKVKKSSGLKITFTKKKKKVMNDTCRKETAVNNNADVRLNFPGSYGYMV